MTLLFAETLLRASKLVKGAKTGTFYISGGVRTWTQVFGPLVCHGNSKNVECPRFISRHTSHRRTES